MPIRFPIQVPSCAGTLRASIQADQIGDDEWASILNLYQYGTGAKAVLKGRPGYSKYTTVNHSEFFTGGITYNNSSSTWTLIVGGLTGVWKWTGSAYTLITSSTVSTSTNLWRFVQYKDMIYAARADLGTLKKFKPTTAFASTGIAAPSAAPTVAAAATGTALKAAGVYQVAFSYVDENTGNESDLSPIATLTMGGADKDGAYSVISDSADAYVTHKYIYRSLKDQSGVLYYSGKIAQGVTTYTDSVVEDALGDASPETVGRYTDVAVDVAIWKERLWVTDGVSVFFSDAGRVEMFDPNNELECGSNDGQRITGIVATQNRLWVLKTASLYYITGDSPANFAVTKLSDRHGCKSPRTFKELDSSTVVWQDERDFYASVDGGEPISIGNDQVRDTISPKITDLSHCFSAMYPPNHWYITAIVGTGTSAGEATHALVYNYKEGKWCKFKWEAGKTDIAPSVFIDGFGSDGGRVLYGAFQYGASNNYIYDLVTGSDDDSHNVVWELISKKFSGPQEYAGYLIGVRRVLLCMGAHEDDVVVTLLRADGTYVTRTIAIDSIGNWISVALSTMKDLSPTVQLKLSGTTTHITTLTLSKYTLECVGLAKRPLEL